MSVILEATKDDEKDDVQWVVDALLLRLDVVLDFWPSPTSTKTDAEVSLDFLRDPSLASKPVSYLMWVGITFGLALLKPKR